jgi:phosphatidylinositol kinase/protein kinase (PI-3  family)
VKTVQPLSARAQAQLIASAAGAYIGGYIIGCRDRHWDNILVHKKDGWLFHIDFGHILGHKVTLDTGSFAVTSDLVEFMGADGWRSFVSMSMKAFAVIRKNRSKVLSFVELMCSSLPDMENRKVTLREFIDSTLLMDLDIGQACVKIRAKLTKAPENNKTRLKNAVHGFKTDTLDQMFNKQQKNVNKVQKTMRSLEASTLSQLDSGKSRLQATLDSKKASLTSTLKGYMQT